MRRAFLVMLAVAAMTLAVVVPAPADHLEENSPPDPRHRLEYVTPKPPGTKTTVVLQYGPYVVHPGSDLSRVDIEISPIDGFVIAARPAVRAIDGTEPGDDAIHIHHAHWVVVDPEAPGGNRWFFGTGEEKTRGGGEGYMQADAEGWAAGVRYGIPLHKGDKLAFVSMLHNKTAQTHVVWLEGRFELVHGTREQIAAATVSAEYPNGLDYHPLTPTLHGATYQVPRTGGLHVWPRDAASGSGGIQPGIGHVWTSPFDGTIVIGAGHLHPGGKEVIVSNLGRPDDPCGPAGTAYGADIDGDGFAGKQLLRIQAYYKNVFPSEEFQMGITQPGWRAKVRRGDRIAINGIYDATNYAYPDAMSFFGFYTDTEDVPTADEKCAIELLGGDVNPTPDQPTLSMPNRPFDDHTHMCDPCDTPQATPALGEHTTQVHIAGFLYVPGDLQLTRQTGTAPYVLKGETLRVVNEDWALALVRHSITTCKAPCNGPYAANHPFHDGALDSGALGMTLLDTYQTVKTAPVWELDTTDVDPGWYTYYCRLHPWMRGSFHVVEVAPA